MSTLPAPGWSSNPNMFRPQRAAIAPGGPTPIVVPPLQAPSGAVVPRVAGSPAVPGRRPPERVDHEATIPGALQPVVLPTERAVVALGPGGTRNVLSTVHVAPTVRPPDMTRSAGHGPDSESPVYMADWQDNTVRRVVEPAEWQPQWEQPAAVEQVAGAVGAVGPEGPTAPAGPSGLPDLRAAFEPQPAAQSAAQPAGAADRVIVTFQGSVEFGTWQSRYLLVNTQPQFIVLVEALADGNQVIPAAALAALTPSEGGWLAAQIDGEPQLVYKVVPLIDYVFGEHRHTILYVMDVSRL